MPDARVAPVLLLSGLMSVTAAVEKAHAAQVPEGVIIHRLDVTQLPQVRAEFEVRHRGGGFLHDLVPEDLVVTDKETGRTARVVDLIALPGSTGGGVRTVILVGGNLFYRSPAAAHWIQLAEEITRRLSPGDRLGMVVPRDSVPQILNPDTDWRRAVDLIPARIDSADVADGVLLARGIDLATRAGGATAVLYLGPELPNCGAACRARWRGRIEASRLAVALVPLPPVGNASSWRRLASDVGGMVLDGDAAAGVRAVLAGLVDTVPVSYRATIEGPWAVDRTRRLLSIEVATPFGDAWTGLSGEVPFIADSEVRGGQPARRQRLAPGEAAAGALAGFSVLALAGLLVLAYRRRLSSRSLTQYGPYD